MATRLFIITMILMLLAGAAAAQLTNETPLSQPQYGPAPSVQSSPVVASDGTDFLVAWLDWRAMPGSIYANRVTRDGHVLDGTGIRVAVDPASANARLVGLFYIDGAYTLIYAYQLFSPIAFRTAAVIISADGHLLDGPRIILDQAAARVAASNSSRIVVVASDTIIVLNGRADVIDRFRFPGTPPYGLSIASNGSTFLMGTFAYDGASNIVGLIALDANGHLTDATRIGVSASGDGPIIGSDGTDYLVLYNDVRSFKAVAQSVTAHAEIRATSTLDVEPHSVLYGALLWTGRTYLLATTTTGPGQPIAVLNLDRTGTFLGTSRLLGDGTPGAVNYPSMAWNGRDLLLAWTSGSQGAPNGWEIQGALLNADGTLASSVLSIPVASNTQVAPVIATNGSQELAAWAEPTGVYATRIASDGVGIDGRGIPVFADTTPSRSVTLGVVQTVRVVFDGMAYLVAWGGYGGVMGQRIDPRTGSKLGDPIKLAPCATSFELSNDGISAVIFATDCSGGHLYAQRIGVAGAVGPAVAISPAGMLTGSPRAAWNGHQWLVAWNQLIRLPTQFDFYRGNVYAARLSGALTVLDTQPIAIAVSDFDESAPLVASDGRDFVLVWSHRSFDAARGLYLRRVHSDGSIGDSSSLITGGYGAQSLVWNGLRYALAYASDAAYWNHDLFLTHIPSREDEPLVRDQTPISASEFDERYVSLAAPSKGRLRIVYTRVAVEPEYGGVSRVFMRDEIDTPRRRSVGRH